MAIDRIQVTQNDKVFALTGPVELAMDLLQPYGLVTDDEPFGIRLAAFATLAPPEISTPRGPGNRRGRQAGGHPCGIAPASRAQGAIAL